MPRSFTRPQISAHAEEDRDEGGKPVGSNARSELPGIPALELGRFRSWSRLPPPQTNIS